MAVKKNSAAFVEAAIRDYERRNMPLSETRDYAQEEANSLLRETARANVNAKIDTHNKSEFLKNVKTMMLEECLLKLYNESLASILSESEQDLITDNMRRNMIHQFVVENGGANQLLMRFYRRNVFLSELASCVNYYSELVCEACKKDDKCKDIDGYYKIPSDVQDSFYRDLDTGDFGDVTMQISGRVIDAIDRFVVDNNEVMNNIKEILTTTKEKIASSKKIGTAATDEATMLENVAKRQITSLKQRRAQNLFGVMVEQTAKNIVKDKALSETFVHNGSLDVDKIKTYCAASYTLIEMANTSCMVKVDEEYIKNFIKTL